MKLMIAFTTGFAAGAYTYSKLTEEQRAGVADQLDALVSRGRSGTIVATVRSGVGNVADVATDRVTDVADTVTAKLADTIDTDDDAAVSFGV